MIPSSAWLMVVALLAAAYLLGSVPTAVWLGKAFFGKDVRDFGSHNAGATNTFRVLGAWPGIIVLVLDTLKGWLAIFLADSYSPWGDTRQGMAFLIAAAVAAVLGHVFPILAGFRGGKGIATMLGIVMYLYPETFPLLLIIFLVVFLSTGYVSLGSILAAVSFPLIAILVFREEKPALIALSIAIAITVPITHRRNIIRLLRREENRITVFRRKEGRG